MNSTPTSKLVLVVDDDPTTRLMASARLGSAGFQIAEAANGSCALESLQSRRPDLVLLDVDMPGMDGFAACKQIREREDCANLPILMMTGLDDVESIEQAFTAGATDFATKPINWALTIRRIRYLLRANRMLSDLEHAAVAISRGQRMLDGAERLARMGSWEWDPAENRLQLSQGLELLWGCTSSGGQHTLETVLERVSDADRDAVRDAIDDALSGIGRDVHHEIRSGDGLLHHIQHRMEPVVDEDSGRVTLRAIALDVTEQHIADEKIRRLAYFDGLTGLPNRESFKDRLGQEVERARRQQGLLATLFLDLDEFKRINDTLGHAAGDQLLRQVATRLQESVRSGDLVGRGPVNGADGAVARLGGDEFTLLVSEMKNPQDAARVAERILESLSRPVAVGGQDVVVSPSIGIAVYPQDGTDAQTLLECADTAMYFAKRAGKNVFRFYDASMSEAARRRLIMEHQLREAIDNGELELHYQPQMELDHGEIESVEALLRWNNPEFGSVSPAEFIPLAESTRLILPIGDWVLDTACRQLRAWRDDGVAIARVAVNISAVQFMQPKFTDTVQKALRDHDLPGDSLELEITESLLAGDVELVVSTLNALKQLGVQLSIDDFGTGYSSLSQLKRFPVDRLKIDQSFVRDITSDSDDAAIAMAVIGMAGSMQLRVVAEGVETSEQLEFLKTRHCDEVQGYLLSRPLPPGQVATMLRERMADAPPAQDPRSTELGATR